MCFLQLYTQIYKLKYAQQKFQVSFHEIQNFNATNKNFMIIELY